MKKRSLFILGATAVACFGLVSCGDSGTTDTSSYKVAMITDYGDITDQSFNQATYEGCVDWCKENNVTFTYKKPASNSDASRIESVDGAIEEGYNVIVMPGYAFAPTIDKVADANKDVKFIALDVALGDLLGAHFSDYNYDPTDSKWSSYTLPTNVYCAVYQEELCGYMAGYAAVKEGYTKLAFLGGMAVPAVVRYGYGYVQGCDAAAEGKSISIKYAYGNQFYGDADIKARTDTWYTTGTEVTFACGGGIYTSACESAKENGGKVIGVDVDQSKTINAAYGDGMCITSAMKGLSATVKTKLGDVILDGKWESKIETLGLVSGTDVDSNYVQLPTATWSMTKFTVDDYKALVKKMYAGDIKVSNSTSEAPTVSSTTSVDYQGNIKG
ncbi:MAG: BMP family ABC transporter substrate-binding protein [Bacilli bacterium]